MNAAARIGAALAAFAAVLVLALLALAWRPALRPVSPPAASAFTAGQVQEGAGLARIGDCLACHTAAGGAPYAGGRAIATPFGTIYATNITPDPKTGIGAWSLAAFRRALRQGVARNGAQLYPAFPYDHFRRLTEPDIAALYAFLMTRRPVHARALANHLVFPLGFRPLLAGWKLLFLPAATPPPAQSDPLLARGAYLVAGLGHCGACHTPHDRWGAEEAARDLDGGIAQGWYAPPLNAASPAATAWTAERLYAFLRNGLDLDHAAAAGPMGKVTRDLSGAPEADVRAISAYIATRMAGASAARGITSAVDRPGLAAREHPLGAKLYAGACAGCHDPGAPMRTIGRPPLQRGSPLQESTARNALLTIRQGLNPPVGRAGPFMPAFGDVFTDAQLAELVAYLRARFSDRPPWPDLRRSAARSRREAAG